MLVRTESPTFKCSIAFNVPSCKLTVEEAGKQLTSIVPDSLLSSASSSSSSPKLTDELDFFFLLFRTTYSRASPAFSVVRAPYLFTRRRTFPTRRPLTVVKTNADARRATDNTFKKVPIIFWSVIRGPLGSIFVVFGTGKLWNARTANFFEYAPCLALVSRERTKRGRIRDLYLSLEYI